MVDGVSVTNPGSFTPNVNFTAGLGVRQPEQQLAAEAKRVPDSSATDSQSLVHKDPEQAHFEAVHEAASTYIANLYPVSDSRFTIYKQYTGGSYTYVTRVTSLRDGSVKVLPDQQLFTAVPRSGSHILEARV